MLLTKEVHKMNDDILADSATSRNNRTIPIYKLSAASAAYTFLRHTGFILDELCAQGLVLWLDDNDRWQWRWLGTDLKSAIGFWAIGEALVDAVIGRFPKAFSIPNKMDEPK